MQGCQLEVQLDQLEGGRTPTVKAGTDCSSILLFERKDYK